MSAQINKVFGETLEFSCTVEEGKIVSQELVSSGPDAHISFKLDKGSYLDADELEDIARQIRAAQREGMVLLAAPDQVDAAIASAKETLKKSGMFNYSIRIASLAIAEHELNKMGLTMYANCVVGKVKPDPAPALAPSWNLSNTVEAGGYDEQEDEDWDDDDDDWDYEEDDKIEEEEEDDDYYQSGFNSAL